MEMEELLRSLDQNKKRISNFEELKFMSMAFNFDELSTTPDYMRRGGKQLTFGTTKS